MNDAAPTLAAPAPSDAARAVAETARRTELGLPCWCDEPSEWDEHVPICARLRALLIQPAHGT